MVSIGSEGKRSIAGAELWDEGRYERGAKVGLVARAIVASVSIVELDRP